MLKVVFEDNHLLLVIKPANLPVQADMSGEIDLQTIAKRYLKSKYDKPGEVFCALVHRLDRTVSGLMVLAKTSKAASRLSEQIRNRDFGKWYIARLNGTLLKKDGLLENYLTKNEKKRMAEISLTNTNDSKFARLKFKEIKIIDGDSVVEIELETGRFHQIRAQFAFFGYPLYGDHKYDMNKAKSPILHLFSHKLEFKHPTRDEILTFESLPDWL